MKIEVSGQEEYPGLSDIPVTEIARITCEQLELTAGECHIIFRNDSDLQKLHETYFEDSSPTDVITFNLGEDRIEGEIYIAEGQAKQQSREYDVSLQEEIARLIIHGILHLKGYEDVNEKDRRVMKVREDALLEYVKKTVQEGLS